MIIRSFLILSLGLLCMQCAQVTHIAGEGARNYRISDRTQDLSEDDEMHALILPYREQLKAHMDQVIGSVEQELTKGALESSLGNWVADAVYQYAERSTGNDYAFGLCNSGGIRINSVAAGPITKRTVFELMPFDNYLVTIALPGEVVKTLFDRMADYGGWPISGNVRYLIDGKKAVDITIDGKALDLKQQYIVVLSDYLAEGGGNCDFLESFSYENLEVYYRDAMIQHIQWLTTQDLKVKAEIEGRVRIKE